MVNSLREYWHFIRFRKQYVATLALASPRPPKIVLCTALPSFATLRADDGKRNARPCWPMGGRAAFRMFGIDKRLVPVFEPVNYRLGRDFFGDDLPRKGVTCGGAFALGRPCLKDNGSVATVADTAVERYLDYVAKGRVDSSGKCKPSGNPRCHQHDFLPPNACANPHGAAGAGPSQTRAMCRVNLSAVVYARHARNCIG